MKSRKSAAVVKTAGRSKQTRKHPVRSGSGVRSLTAEETSLFESTAEQISAQIRERHMPYRTIMDPIFESPEGDRIVSYTRTGDSAIWTGHFLAAEAFRYRVTANPAALDNVRTAIAGIRALVDITATNALARVAIPVDSPYAAAVQKEEGGHGVFQGSVDGRKHFWIGNTTRDQYSGVLFGLGVALEYVREVRDDVADLITRLVGYLVDHVWTVSMPNGRISTVFLQRPEQQLAFLLVAAKANSKEFKSRYNLARLTKAVFTVAPIGYEVLDDHHSYFKFNLDTINLYSLIHLESDASFKKTYLKAYAVLRRTTDDHRNAHFNMIDHALKGADRKRDGQTVEFLKSWLLRPRRDPFVDLRGRIKACGDDRACEVISIEQRPTTDFLWQRSPFLLYGGGVGVVEGPGIDFILPYWMARFYKVL